MNFKQRTITRLADMICGNFSAETSLFRYRSSNLLTKFFADCGTEYRHDGSTRGAWVASVLCRILEEPHSKQNMPSETFLHVIRTLMDPEDATNEGNERLGALRELNGTLSREGYEVFRGDDNQWHLKHQRTNDVSLTVRSPHRPLTAAERQKRALLFTYLETASEDDITSEVLLPLFRQLGFHRITAAGHKDKALEYGKDVWMKFVLPTTHVLYFGMQVKRAKLDSAGVSKGGNANVAEVLSQVLMMLGHPIFDPEIGKHALVDHAFIVSAGEITKAARNWLGSKLDASQRSQILFMDRDDILDLFVVANLPLPEAALPHAAKAIELSGDDTIPF